MRRLLIVAAAFVLLLVGGAYWLFWAAAGPKEGPHAIVVEEGSTLGSVARQLETAGAIPGSAGTFRTMARIFGSGDPIQAGEFEIPKGMGGAGVLDLLQHGKPVQRLITVTEGMPSIIVQEKLAAVAGRMQAAMTKTLSGLWAKRKPTCPVNSPAEAIIMASIVEKETGKPSERRTVAGVYCNRLRIGMKLDADPTVIYPITKGKPLGRRIFRSELNDATTGYNTYRMAGLPAGPIANPGRDSIAAVLDPAPTNALYFVADGTGGHVFAATLAEHNANVRKWYAIRRARGEM